MIMTLAIRDEQIKSNKKILFTRKGPDIFFCFKLDSDRKGSQGVAPNSIQMFGHAAFVSPFLRIKNLSPCRVSCVVKFVFMSWCPLYLKLHVLEAYLEANVHASCRASGMRSSPSNAAVDALS